MKLLTFSTKTFGSFHSVRGMAAAIFLTVCVSGCASYPGVRPGIISGETNQAALKKELANDSFPTAKQAGITSSVLSSTH